MTLQLISQLGLIGLFAGAIPLIYSALRGKAQSFSRLTWLVLFCTFDLIIFGAFTRLTDSGLGCPDWPGCYGHSNPLLAMDKILSAQDQMPFGPVSVSKAWVEMLHRYFAMGVGFLIILLSITAWFRRAEFGKKTFIFSLGLLLLVCLQGAFGAWTVTLRLQPIIVTTHLLLALLLLVGLASLTEISANPVLKKPLGTRFPIWVAGIGIIVLFCQVFLGGWVSTNYAVLACRDFPLCNGQWIPEMDLSSGFSLWRALGETNSGTFIDIKALVGIHWVHRLGAVIALFTIFSVWRNIQRSIPKDNHLWNKATHRWASILGALGMIQLLTGLSNIVLEWPLFAALAHTAGAAALLVCMTKLVFLAMADDEI